MSLLERIRQALGGEPEPRPSPWSHPETTPDSGSGVEGDPSGGRDARGYRHADPREPVAFEDEQPERRRPADR